MQRQTWLPGGIDGYGEAAPIGELDWMGLAGAEAFPCGTRPWLWQAVTPGDGLVQVCADANGCEIHYYDGDGPDHECQSWQWSAPLTASMGHAVAEAARRWVIATGPDAAAKRMGFAPN